MLHEFMADRYRQPYCTLQYYSHDLRLLGGATTPASELADKQADGLFFGAHLLRRAASRPSSAEAHTAIKPAHECDTPVVSLPLLTLSSGYATIVKVRLCDYCSPCRQACAANGKIQNGSCWEFGVQGRRLLLQVLPGVRSIPPRLFT